ncbi:hypothetical protein NA57DRAFT_58373 [Rhizodiscina lignyota]|uniref:Uncharacterized protein n=1 Tax=Rhizodiscina lignyota TaxID=1504668 RepID=A0A9P4IBR2_9PEZI|nr:hypothetical protein NA57DRAFT_58373 [Rhizodiscina lignyota]
MPQPTLASPYASRPGSACSNDRWSVTSPVPYNSAIATPTPPPAYVAVAAATQMVNDHHANEEYEQQNQEAAEGEKEGAQFSEEALGLLNAFLDQTLFSILATARSGKLKKLRPAITEVLKPRLAREAIASADEELRELLDGEEEDTDDEGGSRPVSRADAEGVADLRNGATNGDINGFNLALTWKRTRLRIMVYTRLGDLEDEDEDRFLDDDEEFHHAKHDAAEVSRANGDTDSETIADLGLVSPAAAIFLTSVIEYLAEQTIVLAGQAAFTRSRKQRASTGSRPPQQAADAKVVVMDLDMEKVALSPVLGRLWRTWRKRTRGTHTPGSPGRRGVFGSFGSLGPRSVAGESSAWGGSEAGGSRRPSVAVADAEAFHVEKSKDEEVPDTREHSELEMAANIALPLPEAGNDRDVEEIEVPGLAKEIVDEEPKEEVEKKPRRRVSFSEKPELIMPLERPTLRRLRSNSAPGAAPSKTWLEYLMGSHAATEEAIDEEKDDSQDSEKKSGLIAGAAAAIGSAITAVVSRSSKADEDEEEEGEGEREIEREEGGEETPEKSGGKEQEEETAEALAQQKSAKELFDEQSQAAESGTSVEPNDAVVEEEKPAPKPLTDQERALIAAERHVKGLLKETPKESAIEAQTEKTGEMPVVAEAGEEEDMSRPKHLSALPAPLKVQKSPDSTPTQEHPPPFEIPPATAVESDAVTVPEKEPRMDATAATAVGAAAAAGAALSMADMDTHKEVVEERGPAVPPKDEPSQMSPRVPPKDFPSPMVPPKDTEFQAVAAAQRTPEQPIQAPAPQTGAAQKTPMVDDDYDPFSTVAYTSVASNRVSTAARGHTDEYDSSAIGFALSSDHAIPAPRTPSPQSSATSAQQNRKGIQGQMMGDYQQKPTSQPQQGVPQARNVNGAQAGTYPPFAPSGPRDTSEERPQSAHRGDSGLSNHRNVNQFVSAPNDGPLQPPPKSASRPGSRPGSSHQSPAQQQGAFPPRTTSALQAISNASAQVPDRSDKRKSSGASTASANSKSKALPPLQTDMNEQKPANKQLSTAAAASAEARPSSSRSTRRNTGGSGKEGDASGLMPRPVDPNRASSESKRRDFEELLKSGESETVKYTLTPVRVADESGATPTTTLKPSPTPSERQTVSQTPGPAAPAPVREVPQPTNSTRQTTTSAAPAPAGIKHTPTPSSTQVTYRTIPTPTHSRKNTQSSVNRVPGPQPVGSNLRDRDSTASSNRDSAGTTANMTAANAPEQPAKKKKLTFVAREPRVMQESMRDFADFIRTTGPDKEMNVVPIIPRSGSRQAGSVGSGSMLNSFTAHSAGGANRFSGGSTDALVSTGAAATAPSSSGGKRKSNMQARDPAVKQQGNRDLIDFIRQGPPGAGGPLNQPNPRVVAPFNNNQRNTFDSDDMTSSTRNSNAPSTNSRTALLGSGMGGNSDGGIPKKTRRRVKDPYAIDMDDEDEDLLTALPGAHRPQRAREEESLVDFLRNTEPPSNNAPQALTVGVGGGRQANGSANGSANGASRSRSNSNNPSGANGASVSAPSTPTGSVRARAGVAKAARTEQHQTTNDLADFLRSSGPPGGGSSSDGPPPGSKAAKLIGSEGPGLGRMGSKSSQTSKRAGGSGLGTKFWRRKATVDV